MPKTSSRGEPKQSELPSTLRRSSKKAQDTFAKAHDSALEEYGGDEERVPGRLRRAQAQLRAC